MKLRDFLNDVTIDGKTIKIMVNRNNETWSFKDKDTFIYRVEVERSREEITPEDVEPYLDFLLIRTQSKIHNVFEMWVKEEL